MNIPDVYDLWEAHDQKQEKELEKLPYCEICGDPIQDDHLYLINDEFVCPACLEREFRKDTDYYVE